MLFDSFARRFWGSFLKQGGARVYNAELGSCANGFVATIVGGLLRKFFVVVLYGRDYIYMTFQCAYTIQG